MSMDNHSKPGITTKQISDMLREAIAFTIEAHGNRPKKADNAVRFWDMKTPYAIHPIWCATTLLSETQLDFQTRYFGSKALLFHDILEDTNATLPEGTEPEVVRLVHALTYESLGDEMEKIWNTEPRIRLLKLYDKVSSLLDATWMKPEKRARFETYTLALAEDVVKNYGALNVTKMAAALCHISS